MCLGHSTETLSSFSILVGLISLLALFSSFISNGWVYTKEPYRIPDLNAQNSITFKIGFWKLCYSLKRTNSTIIDKLANCSSVNYSDWSDISYQHFRLTAPADFTMSFVSKIRWSTIFTGLGLFLLIIAVVYSMVGHCYQDNKTILASAIYTLSGLSLSLGIFIIVNILTQELDERSGYRIRHRGYFDSPDPFNYQYGWCFYSAIISCILNSISAILSVSAFYQREEILRTMMISTTSLEEKVRDKYFTSSSHMVDKNSLLNIEQPENSNTEEIPSINNNDNTKYIDTGSIPTNHQVDIHTTYLNDSDNNYPKSEIETIELKSTPIITNFLTDESSRIPPPNEFATSSNINNNNNYCCSNFLTLPNNNRKYSSLSGCALHPRLLGLDPTSSSSSTSSSVLIGPNPSPSRCIQHGGGTVPRQIHRFPSKPPPVAIGAECKHNISARIQQNQKHHQIIIQPKQLPVLEDCQL